MTGPRIYVCSGDCSVAFPESLDIPESITMCPEDLGFPECPGCKEMYVEEDMLHLEITETGLVAKKSCMFSFLAGSHKSFVPHTCTCSKPAVSELPEPKIEPETAITADQATIKEPKQTVSEPEIQNVGFRKWEPEELEVIITCNTPDEAIARFRDTFPGRRNDNAVKQQFYSLQRKGKLLAKGLSVVILGNGVFGGHKGVISGFTNAKTGVNVKLEDGCTLQLGLFDVEVVRQ